MPERYLIAFLGEIAKRGTAHRLVDLYLLKLTEDPEYANPFRYFVAYEAGEYVND